MDAGHVSAKSFRAHAESNISIDAHEIWDGVASLKLRYLQHANTYESLKPQIDLRPRRTHMQPCIGRMQTLHRHESREIHCVVGAIIRNCWMLSVHVIS